MKLSIIETTKAPQPIGPYSQAVKAGNFIFTSGQIPIDPETGNLVQDGIEAQTKQVLDNLKNILNQAGADFKDVVETMIFIKDLKNFILVNTIYASYMGQHKPARTTIEAAALPLDCGIEIKMVAYTGK